MRIFVMAGAVLLTLSCYHGPSLSRFAPAYGPNGIDAVVRLEKRMVQGELLEVQDSALIVLTDSNRLAIIAVRGIRRASFGDLGEILGAGADVPAALAQLRPFSRYPQGLTPALRSRLLVSYGQTALDVVR